MDQVIIVEGREEGGVETETTYTITNTTSTVGIGGSPSTTYSYTYSTTYLDPETGTTNVLESGSGSSSSRPDNHKGYYRCQVPVKYEVTLRKKWKLSHLYLYLIKDNSVIVNVENGSTTGDLRGGVYENSDTGITVQLTESYKTSVTDKLGTYYKEYNDTRRKIDSAIRANLKTGNSDFKEDEVPKYKVGQYKYNGIRKATANITYQCVDLASGGTSTLEDLNHKYNDKDRVNGNERINIYTPLSIGTPTIESTASIINHTGDKKYNSAIQRGVPFTFTPKVSSISYGTTSVNTNDFINEYYVKFDFNLTNITPKYYYYLKEDGSRAKIGDDVVEAGTYIIIPKDGSITATANDVDVSLTSNKIRIFASTVNELNQDFADNQIYNSGSYIDTSPTSTTYIDNNSITQRGENSLILNENVTYNGPSSTMYLDARYIVYKDASTSNVGRIYDFRITDCTDLGYKNVFRSLTTNEVNKTNSNNYFYSGKIGCYEGTNVIYNRLTNNILPLGPYKNNEDVTYIYAPKLGYRFSFDVKTTGSIGTESKKVKITPSYYYISKNGATYLGDDEVTLYYKTASGKYKKFKDSGYSIQFKPNDGYRATEFNNMDTLSTRYINLNISKGFELSKNTMSTISDDGYLQCWYGEFKLPNSTIVVKNGGSINTPLTDGYIGVKFKIEAIESGRTLAYGNTDLGLAGGAKNSTQWDYEGYLGYNYISKGGSDVSSGDVNSIQLEKGTWKIESQAMYEKVKGTVMLYDIDNRAANDFN